MFTDIRLLGQQLAEPQFDTPRELVSHMGAMQAQSYGMAKWAVGIRLRSGSIGAVEEALARGEILRTHVMRPTWHFVAAEVLHLLPAYDEYLIAYKDRTGVLAPEHQAKAFNSFGIFQPVVLHNGHIRGNWGRRGAEISFFEPEGEVPAGLLEHAIHHYRTFHTKKP